MEQKNELVVCQGLTKTYGSIHALDNLNLTLERGRFIGLLGPNGSGKTTAIKLLCGLIQPTSGTVTIDGAQPGVHTHSVVSYLPRPGLPERLDARVRPDRVFCGLLRGF